MRLLIALPKPVSQESHTYMFICVCYIVSSSQNQLDTGFKRKKFYKIFMQSHKLQSLMHC